MDLRFEVNKKVIKEEINYLRAAHTTHLKLFLCCGLGFSNGHEFNMQTSAHLLPSSVAK